VLSPPSLPEALLSLALNSPSDVAIGLAVGLAMLMLVLVLLLLPLGCYLYASARYPGNARTYVKWRTTHSNPRFLLRYLPCDEREALSFKLKQARSRPGPSIGVSRTRTFTRTLSFVGHAEQRSPSTDLRLPKNTIHLHSSRRLRIKWRDSRRKLFVTTSSQSRGDRRGSTRDKRLICLE